MGITYTEEQRREMIEQIKGKTIMTMTYEQDGGTTWPYWIIELDDGSEFSFRFMAEIV